uniref:Uncharacterized protein n=1 Tax=Scinaia undulata TaxID=1884664 RepID=A0A1G4NXI9_9FLOR|nr:Hypothetical protein ORF_3 [Scinaia undulata]SCW23372.1 Hypothetical protein ORF_3 [Scinaia undulata]
MKVVIQDISHNTNCRSTVNKSGLRYKLFYLQKKIYQASRECNIPLVHSLQKLLIASSSIQLLAEQKWISKYNNCINLAHQNKQIAEWCLEAEWKTRLYVHEDYYYINNISSLCLLSKAKVFCTNLDEKYLAHKLQSIAWIEKQITSWLQEQSLVQYIECNTGNQIFTSNKKELVLNLLNMILVNGLQWTYFRQEACNSINSSKLMYYLKQETYVYQHKRLSSFSAQLMDNFLYNIGIFYPCIKSNWLSYCRSSIGNLNQAPARDLGTCMLLDYIKDILFHKDKIGRLRANHELFVRKNIKAINSILLRWLMHYGHFLSHKIVIRTDKDIDRIIYKWTKKKNFISEEKSKRIANSVSLLQKISYKVKWEGAV